MTESSPVEPGPICEADTGRNSTVWLYVNPSWPAEWQRHYAALRELVADEEGQAEVLPGFPVHGMGVGKWLVRHRKPDVWQALTDRQRKRLEQLGITPLTPESVEPVKSSITPVSAFERGVTALA